jgi:hypothetical protein
VVEAEVGEVEVVAEEEFLVVGLKESTNDAF